jgi:hypothetical protein
MPSPDFMVEFFIAPIIPGSTSRGFQASALALCNLLADQFTWLTFKNNIVAQAVGLQF